jgi:hypothetical protein
MNVSEDYVNRPATYFGPFICDVAVKVAVGPL